MTAETTLTIPHETGDRLENLFRIVIDEARSNPDFAGRLRDALSDSASERAAKPKPRKSPRNTEAAPALHAVNILRQHGEHMLRGRLSNTRTKSELTAIAKRSGLRLTGKAAQKSATRTDLIDGIVEAAKQYDRQRQAVEG